MPKFGRIELEVTNAKNIAAGVRRRLEVTITEPDENKRQIVELAEAVERLSDAVIEMLAVMKPQ